LKHGGIVWLSGQTGSESGECRFDRPLPAAPSGSPSAAPACLGGAFEIRPVKEKYQSYEALMGIEDDTAGYG
jgi:hypothetical protein